MEEALRNVFAMFLIMMASYLLMKRAPFPVKVVNGLVFNFFLPVTTFYAVVGLRKIPTGDLLLLMSSGFGITFIMYLLAVSIARLFGFNDRLRRTFLLGVSYGNHIFLGLPVCFAFMGERGTVLALFFALGGYLFLYGVGVYIMTGRITPAALLKNPMILAMGAGMLCVVSDLPIPSLLSHTFSLMNSATFPLSMMVVGGGLQLRLFLDSSRVLPLLCASAVKLILSPVVAWGIALALGLNQEQVAICVLQAAMPTAVLVTVFSVQYEADPVFSNAVVSLTTLACMGVIPVLFFLLK
ncbi:MAG: AEC family transporter [Thermodesulfobacteriota bacterium]